MDDTLQWFEQGLTAHLFALEAAQVALERGDPGVVPAVQRLAASLLGLGAGEECAAIVAAARRLTEATDPQVLERLADCVGTVRSATNDSRAAPLDILIVDDDPVSARYLQATLAMPNRTFRVAGTVAAAERWLADALPAMILLDLKLPDQDGRSLLMTIRHRPRLAAVPVIVLTGTATPQGRTECFALGADEYIGKPFDPVSLATCVAAKLHRSAEMTRWSRTDPLTGMPNRGATEEAFDRFREASARMGMPLALALIEVTGLDRVSDARGRSSGDAVLTAAAQALLQCLRKWDHVGRWDDTHFVVLLPSAGEAGAHRAMEKVAAKLREAMLEQTGGQGPAPGFAVSVVSVTATTRLSHVLERAQSALGHAPEIPGTGDGPPATTAPNHRALVVEDDHVMAAVMCGMLRLGGFVVERVGDGEAALAWAEQRASGLVVLDVRLPGVSGLDVLRNLRERPTYRRSRLVLVSGVRDGKEVARGLQLGADDYIVKPFSPVEFMARIHRLEPGWRHLTDMPVPLSESGPAG